MYKESDGPDFFFSFYILQQNSYILSKNVVFV